MINTAKFKFSLLALGALSLNACSSSTSDRGATTVSAAEQATTHDFRAEPPKAGPEPKFEAPIPKKHVLPNGMTLLLHAKRDLPLLHVRTSVRAGSAYEPTDKTGLASFTGSMLRSGTKGYNATELSDAFEHLGSSLAISVGSEATLMGASVLSQHREKLLELFAEVLRTSRFPQAEVERVRKQKLTTLIEALDEPRSVADQLYQELIFPNHAYGTRSLGTQKSLDAIQRKDLVTYYNNYFIPAHTALVIVGDFDPDTIINEIEALFGTWESGKNIPNLALEAPQKQDALIAVVDRPKSPQSQLRVGHLGVKRDNPDYYSLVIGNAILGGQFNSRINMNLREDKGYTYGAFSYFDFRRFGGAFTVQTGVRSDVTVAALHEILKEIDTIRADGVTQEELELAISSYSRSLAGKFQNAESIGSMLSNIYLYDLPVDYYREQATKLQTVTIADVERVLDQYLAPEDLSLVIVGDFKLYEKALSDLGERPIKKFDKAGNLEP